MIDFVDKREGCSGLLRQAHQIQNSGERSFSAGLALTGEKLQLFVITELDENVDRPFAVVFMLGQLNLSRTADTVEGRGELLAYAFN